MKKLSEPILSDIISIDWRHYPQPLLKGTQVIPVFTTTVHLSETALLVAEALFVQIKNLHLDKSYPLIKCNINGKEKIYHLPFDQQYDRIKIKFKDGECYVHTVAEAEKLGFRRAMRYTNF
jgi:hypothetical protein